MKKSATTTTEAATLIALAEKHCTIHGRTSASFCLLDARRLLLVDGKAEYAARWAVQSLGHSVGIFHPDRVRAGEILGCGEHSPFNADFIRDRV